MKNNIVLFILLLLSGCKKHEDKWEPPSCAYSAIVNLNGVAIKNCVAASVNKVYKYGMNFSQYENGLKYAVTITVIPPYHADDYYALYNDSIVSTEYTESCCESMPDQVNKWYFINVPDSSNCYLRLHLDTVNFVASGMIKAIYKNQEEPFDLVHVQCDTFFCKYTKY